MRDHRPVVDMPLMRKYGCVAQCCASYPPADRFVEGFDPVAYGRHLEQRSIGGLSRPLQLYISAAGAPFTGDETAAIESPSVRGSLWDVEREIALVDRVLRGNRRVLKLHCRGMAAVERPSRIIETLQGAFDFDENGEYSIEMGPDLVLSPKTRSAVEARERSHAQARVLDRLRLLGFNRIAIRVAALSASRTAMPGRVELTPSEAQALVGAARIGGFRAIDIELAYGDRGQSAEEFQALVEQVVALTPDRVTLVADSMCLTADRSACASGGPRAERQLLRFRQAVEALDAAGYMHVALGHFSQPSDRLAVASRNGSLARDYCSYSVGLHSDCIGFGPRGTSNVGPLFVQNTDDPDRYREMLDAGLLPIARGIELGADELVRKTVIDAFACQSEVSKDSISAAYLIDFDRYFAPELESLKRLADDGVVEFDHEWIAITERGRLLAGMVGEIFDARHVPRPPVMQPLRQVVTTR